MVLKKCVVCGKTFQAVKHNITCSVECRQTNKRLVNNKNHYRAYHGKKRVMKDMSTCKSVNLNSDIIKAKEMGLSYGQFKALQYANSV